jgi:type IV pilus assembly protein PilB
VRRICPSCREETTVSPELLLDMQLTPDKIAGKKFYRGRGCEACNNSGYRGRRGLFELMIMNDEIRDMIMRNASTDDLRTAAQGYGMVTLRDAGLIAIFAGDTTIEEVLRETIIEG